MIPFDGGMTCWTLFGGALVAGAGLGLHGARCASPAFSAMGGVLAAAALAWASSPALAAEDAAALVHEAEARGRAAETALRDWAAEIAGRGAAYEADARALAAGNAHQLKRGLQFLEAEPLFGADVDVSAFDAPNDAGIVYVAVSFSMESRALRALAEEARRAGAVLVVRGFVDGSVGKTLTLARAAFDDSTAAGVAVDPQVFRAFGVTRAPTFIAARAAVPPCEEGVDCTSPAPAHDRLAGNITLAEALRLIADRGADAPDVARAALSMLED